MSGEDAALAMAPPVLAAGMAGLGTCPASYAPNHVERAAAPSGLPRGVFPVAGLTLDSEAARPRCPDIQGPRPAGRRWSENGTRRLSAPQRCGFRTPLRFRGGALG